MITKLLVQQILNSNLSNKYVYIIQSVIKYRYNFPLYL
jgi:hypothetical protein